jgi:hypothetical protein
MYEGLPEHHIFKNRYFACIVHILLTLVFLALKILLRLLQDGKISLETSQLVDIV